MAPIQSTGSRKRPLEHTPPTNDPSRLKRADGRFTHRTYSTDSSTDGHGDDDSLAEASAASSGDGRDDANYKALRTRNALWSDEDDGKLKSL